jgi:3-oxoadipate enol-lactonase
LINNHYSKITMPYLTFGTGEPLVLIHGLGEMKESWYQQFELSDQYQLIIPDLRGHGENTILKGISIANFACDITKLLYELNIESAHICGISLGGVVAQEIYKQKPESCKSLILVSTFYYAPPILTPAFIYTKLMNSFFLTSEQIQEIYFRKCIHTNNNRIKKTFFHLNKPNNEAFIKSSLSCLKIDYRLLLSKINIPVLVMGSLYDQVLPVWNQISKSMLIPNSKLHIFNNAGHISKLEIPDEFNSVLRNFLSKNSVVATT